MEQKFLEKQRKNLLAFREELAEDIQSIQGNTVEADGSDEAEDREDVAAINTIRELDIAGGDMLKVQLGEIDQALAAMEEGTYGTCQNCGREINPERLLAKPWAILCIDCQEAVESSHAGNRA